MEEALAAGRAEHLPVTQLSIAAEGVKQLVTHLVTALAELHGYYGHCGVAKSKESPNSGSGAELGESRRSPSPHPVFTLADERFLFPIALKIRQKRSR